jgi:hypothetical protein
MVLFRAATQVFSLKSVYRGEKHYAKNRKVAATQAKQAKSVYRDGIHGE